MLYGVTGSGKTSVFIKLIKSVMDMGKTAVMLVPEISLTPQMLGKFKSLFGDKIALCTRHCHWDSVLTSSNV